MPFTSRTGEQFTIIRNLSTLTLAAPALQMITGSGQRSWDHHRGAWDLATTL